MGKICDPAGPFVEIIDKVKPSAGKPIIETHFPNAFTQTTLEKELEKLPCRNLIITGYMTQMCVNSTTRAAAEAGYHCTIAAGLTATRDLPAALAKSVNLASLADRFAVVVEPAEQIPDFA